MKYSPATTNIEFIGGTILHTKRLIYSACTLAIVATIFSIIVQYLCKPLPVDGGMYSYPALALSRGGDPAENLLGLEQLKNIPGVKAAFGQDFRRSVRVIPMSWWFKIFPPNIWTAKLFGISELCILMILTYFVLRRISTDLNIALLCWAIYVMDGTAITLGSAELRADIMLTILTLLVFLFTRIETQNYRIVVFFFGLLSIFLLALTRVTSAIPLAFLASYLIVELLTSWRNLSHFKKGFFISLIVTGVMSFLLRQRIWDILLPSQYTWPANIVTKEYLYVGLNRGIFSNFAKEYHRWKAYFFLSDVGEFGAILLAFSLLVLHIVHSSTRKSIWTSNSSLLSISVGCFTACAVLTFIDHAIAAPHALSIVPFFILVLVLALESTYKLRIKHLSISMLFFLILLSAGLKIAHGFNLITKHIQSDYSNGAVTNILNHVFQPLDKGYVVIGPTELWPYFNPKTNVVILDPRARLGSVKDVITEVDFIILNRDYEGYNWQSHFKNSYPHVELKTIAQLGNKNSGWDFIKIIKPLL